MMIQRTVLFEAIFPCLYLALLAVGIISHRRASRMGGSDWESLVGRLEKLDQQVLIRIASDKAAMPQVESEDGENNCLDADQIWDLVGGLKGIEVLERNSKILVELAYLVQHQNPEVLIIAEQLRLNSREIQWHIGRLRGAQEVGHLRSSFPDYAQQATVTYVKMVAILIELCEETSSPDLQGFRRAI